MLKRDFNCPTQGTGLHVERTPSMAATAPLGPHHGTGLQGQSTPSMTVTVPLGIHPGTVFSSAEHLFNGTYSNT